MDYRLDLSDLKIVDLQFLMNLGRFREMALGWNTFFELSMADIQ